MEIENESNNTVNGKENPNIEKGGMVDEALNRLGGVLTDKTPIEEPIEEKDQVINETMADGTKIFITEDGSRYNSETGDLILKGSED